MQNIQPFGIKFLESRKENKNENRNTGKAKRI